LKGALIGQAPGLTHIRLRREVLTGTKRSSLLGPLVNYIKQFYNVDSRMSGILSAAVSAALIRNQYDKTFYP